tara:strand:- start:1781 stop:2014 length:234 start_codon:yes stop_codon:yes gene_type:complete
MTETRLKELQTEIARLEALDNKISDRVDNEFTLEETKNYIKTERAKLVYNDDGTVDYNNDEVECSLDLDLEFARESE